MVLHSQFWIESRSAYCTVTTDKCLEALCSSVCAFDCLLISLVMWALSSQYQEVQRARRMGACLRLRTRYIYIYIHTHIRHNALAARRAVLECPCKTSKFLGDLWGPMGWLPGVLIFYRDPPSVPGLLGVCRDSLLSLFRVILLTSS